MIPQTQEWIDEIVAQFRAAGDKRTLLSLGVEYLRCPYVPDVTVPCWKEFAVCMKKIDPSDAGKTVFAVDLPGIYCASFYGNKDNRGEVIGDVVSRVERVFVDTAAEDKKSFFLAIDSTTSWRKELFPAYKGKRQPKPEGFYETYQATIDVLMDGGYTVLQYDGQETDDILASISYRAKLRKQNAVLITEDRDMWQCLGRGTVMYCPQTGDYTNEDKLGAAHKITPKQVVDYLCLIGKNDVPSPYGIGDKLASDYLHKHGTFLGIYDERDSLTDKKREAIENFAKSDYWLARQLHTLNKTLEVLW